jgi:hypothetical protein
VSDVSEVEEPVSVLETIMRHAPELGRRPDRAAATEEMVALAAGDRRAVEAVRDEYVLRLHADSSDYDATAALGVLNRALAHMGWADPYCWKNRRKP